LNSPDKIQQSKSESTTTKENVEDQGKSKKRVLPTRGSRPKKNLNENDSPVSGNFSPLKSIDKAISAIRKPPTKEVVPTEIATIQKTKNSTSYSSLQNIFKSSNFQIPTLKNKN